MNNAETETVGNYVEPETTDFEGSLSFIIRAALIEKQKLWKSKDLTAEFLGNFWKTVLDTEHIQPTLHFVCAELLENAVNHSVSSDYLIMIQLCFKSDELLVYVKNTEESGNVENFRNFARSLLEAENLQKFFVQRIKEAKKSGSKKSQVGLITILKDRGTKLAWKFEPQADVTRVTALARIPLKGDRK